MLRAMLIGFFIASIYSVAVLANDGDEIIDNPPDYKKIHGLDKSDLEGATPEEVDISYGDARSVSMVELLVDPGSFDGVEVQFYGVLSNESEGSAIYLNIESYEYSIPQNAIFLLEHNTENNVLNELEGQYVWIVGTFYQDSASHNFPTTGHLKWIAPLSWSSARQIRRSASSTAAES